jgi:lysophospholipase L1-like esterase
MKIYQIFAKIVLTALPLMMCSCSQEIMDPKPARFAKSIDIFAQQDRTFGVQKGGIVFVGSSSVKRLDIPKVFPGLKALNRGFGGSHISDVNYYIEQTVLKYEPSKVIFYCGGNDLWSGKPPAQVKNDLEEFTSRLFARVPDAQLLVLAVRPSPKRIDIVGAEHKMNLIFSAIASRDERIIYLSGSCDRFLDEIGMPKDGLYADDLLHMNDAGYKIWAEILAPYLP